MTALAAVALLTAACGGGSSSTAGPAGRGRLAQALAFAHCMRSHAALGPRAGWDYFSAETAYALERFQAHLGITHPTGSLSLGRAVFLPSAVKITAWATAVAPGVTATAGAPLMTATSDSPVVTIALDTSQEAEIKAGDTVSVTLPRGNITPGVVTSVGRVATNFCDHVPEPSPGRLLPSDLVRESRVQREGAGACQSAGSWLRMRVAAAQRMTSVASRAGGGIRRAGR